MLSTGEEIRSPQRSSRSGPILAKMPCTNSLISKTNITCKNLLDIGKQCLVSARASVAQLVSAFGC